MAADFIAATTRELRSLKRAAEKAMAQVNDEQFFASLDPETNSIAVLVKHISGNMRSRWTDFLTTDGEKPWRKRDSEFVIEAGDTRAALAARWEEGWKVFLGALESLGPADLERMVTIRTEPYTALGAAQRSFGHYADHIGQLILLAKHFAGANWKTLSVPRGQSEELNAKFIAQQKEKAKQK
jgi:uncharacterized protein DUF1572